jgi:uncharacterized damage-inducible protein DinB
MPTRTYLIAQLELSYGALFRNLEGVTHEESLIVPQPGGNCLNWVLGHIVASRNRVMTQMGIAPVWQLDLAFHYSGRDEANWTRAKAVDLKTISTDLVRSQQEMLNALEQMPEGMLTTPDEQGRSLADMLGFFAFHEAYHVGQIGLLRRIIGKEGVIRPAPLRTEPDLIGP